MNDIRKISVTPNRVYPKKVPHSKLLLNTTSGINLWNQSYLPKSPGYHTTKRSPSPSRNIIEQLKTVYGVTLRNTITKKCFPQENSSRIINKNQGIQLNSLTKYQTKLVFMDKIVHKKMINTFDNVTLNIIPNKNKENYQKLNEYYLNRAQALNRIKAGKEDISELFAYLFEELRPIIPACDPMFSAMKVLAESLSKKTSSKNKSITSLPLMIDIETDGTEVTIEKSKPKCLRPSHESGKLKSIEVIASTKRMSLPNQFRFNKAKLVMKSNKNPAHDEKLKNPMVEYKNIEVDSKEEEKEYNEFLKVTIPQSQKMSTSNENEESYEIDPSESLNKEIEVSVNDET